MGVDPDNVEGADLDAPVGGQVGALEENDPQLFLYGILHDEIRSRISHHYRSLLSGLSIIGIVIAYALLSGEFVFLAVIPALIGFMVVQTVRQLNRILFAASHLRAIEGAYREEFPLFSWEHHYGMSGADRNVQRWGVNWTTVPQLIVLALAVLAYLGSIYAAYAVWPPDGIDILLIGLTRDGLLVVYAIVTLLVGLAGYSFYLHRAELLVRDS